MSAAPTYGTGLLLAIVAIFLGGAIVSAFVSLMGFAKNVTGIKAEVPWWDSVAGTTRDIGRFAIDTFITLAGLILAIAVIAEWYVAAKAQRG